MELQPEDLRRLARLARIDGDLMIAKFPAPSVLTRSSIARPVAALALLLACSPD